MLRKNFIKVSLVSIVILTIGLLINNAPKTMAADSINVTLKINTWAITYATGSTLNLWSGVASYLSQVLSGSWAANAFRVSDMRWTSTWTRSAWISNATAAWWTIPDSAFQIKATAAVPNFMDWDNTCWMTTQLTTSYQVFTGSSQKQFLAKPSNSKICKYWVTPTIMVTIPAFQPVWDYSATITLTSTW